LRTVASLGEDRPGQEGSRERDRAKGFPDKGHEAIGHVVSPTNQF
jgi:hypothetical protein